MNIRIDTIGGGVFSKVMIALQNIERQVIEVEDIENIYIGVDDKRNAGFPFKQNPFDFIFDQNPNESGKVVYAHYIPAIDNSTRFLKSDTLRRLKIIVSKLKFKQSVLDRVPDIKPNTIGVHIRLTDMSSIHPEYGKSNIAEYLRFMEVFCENKDIFVASDNVESIEKIKLYYPNIITNNVSNRNPIEEAGKYFEYQLDNIGDEQFWIDSFVEMLSLAKCEELIQRMSNLNTASSCFSSTLKKTYRVNDVD